LFSRLTHFWALFGIFLLFSPLPVAAQSARTLSDSAQISLLTVAPGEELYSTFGHSALRVRDRENRLDRCYNYGTFDFNQPNFYINFCRGKLLYRIDTDRWEDFEYGNMYERRAMQEQVLRLDREQRQRLFDLLENNMLPQNRSYKYDFFYDNCATRLRDIVRNAAFQVVYDSSHVRPGTTMRHLLHQYLTQRPWTRFGMDLVLGIPTDKVARPDDYMFLPDYVHHVFAATRLNGQPLVTSERRLPQQGFPPLTRETAPWRQPFWIVCALAAIGILCMFNKRASRIYDTLFWFVLGVAGLIIALLWFATDHAPTKMNLNILWALPTHLFFFWRMRRTEITENYFTATAILALLTLIFWNWLPQELPIEGIPIAMLVVVKGFWKRYA
jgi:hypothetical protein